MGEREIIRTDIVEGFEKLTLSDYKWSTFQQVKQRVSNIASGLVDLNIKPAPRRHHADTKMEWQLAAQAVFSQSCSVVTIYATLGAEGVQHGVNQTEAAVVICDGKLLKISPSPETAPASSTLSRWATCPRSPWRSSSRRGAREAPRRRGARRA